MNKQPKRPALVHLAEGLSEPLDDFSFAPFWFWNDRLDQQELERQLGEMKAQGINQAVIHARLGLRTTYLSEEWFDCIGHSIACARKLGMKLWIYDEKNWPSGCAGGLVLEKYPEGRARHVVMHRLTGEEILSNPMAIVPEGDLVAALLVSPDASQVIDVTDQVHFHLVEFDPPSPEWNAYFILERLDKRCHPLALPYQTNCLDPKVVETFIELTHEEYYRRFAADFGETILGFFTDEPGLYYNLFQLQPGSIPWTTGFLEDFQALHGYDLKTRLPWLWEPGALAAQTRDDFWETIAQDFTNAYFNSLRQWCDAHQVQLIGHLEWEEYLSTQVQFLGDFFGPMRQMHMAGVDRIDMNFDKVAEKLASSVQHTTPGMTRTMSESFALTGWDLTLRTVRRIVDWQYVRGVNFIVPHAFFYSIRDARRNECPPSLFFQNTFWPYFRQIADYAKRLGYLLCQGRLETPIAIYHPIHAARRRFDPNKMPFPDLCMIADEADSTTASLDRLILQLTQKIEQLQGDYDFVDDQALADGQYCAAAISVAEQNYRALIVPDWHEVPAATRERLAEWARTGGLLLTIDSPGSGQPAATVLGPNHLHCESPEALEAVIDNHGLRLLQLTHPTPSIRVMCRDLNGERLVMFNNESDMPQEFAVRLAAHEHPCLIDCTSGRIQRLPLRQDATEATMVMTLEGHSSEVVLLASEAWADVPLAAPLPESATYVFDQPWTMELNGQTHLGPLRPWSDFGAQAFSGQAVYKNSFVLTPEQAALPIWLDLGEVCEIAEILVDGQPAGVRCWAPWQLQLPPLATGRHELLLKVTNTPINILEGQARRSGLLGPVRLLAGEKMVRSLKSNVSTVNQTESH